MFFYLALGKNFISLVVSFNLSLCLAYVIVVLLFCVVNYLESCSCVLKSLKGFDLS